MASPPKEKWALQKIHLRQWREHHKLSLEKLAEKIEELGVPVSGGSLSRIERSLQPYNQRLLEAAGAILGCSTVDLLARPPGDARSDLARLVEGIRPELHSMAIKVLKAVIEEEDSGRHQPEPRPPLPN